MKNTKILYIFLLFFGLSLLLVWTRFAGIGWGLPYPYHPDERNIAVAISHLSRESWYRPDFFAYGQLTLYLGYIIAWLINLTSHDRSGVITLEVATLAVRILSAAASCVVSFFIFNIVKHMRPHNIRVSAVALTASIFSPALIQFAHFGTTESILAATYTALIYYLFKYSGKVRLKYIVASAVALGLALAAKVSAGLYVLLPFFIFAQQIVTDFKGRTKYFVHFVSFGFISLIVLVVASPYNIFSYDEFRGAISYESSVALGKIIPFYTRQFAYSIPVIFQMVNVFPYSLGWWVYVFFIIGFVFLPRDRNTNILRLSFLAYFLPTAIMYAKWSRFMAPIFPITIIFAVLVIDNIWNKALQSKRFKYISIALFWMFVFILCLPGIAYLNIYNTPDVRVQASAWIYRNIPTGSNILFETANVVDVPVDTFEGQARPTYKTTSFDFYALDADDLLVGELKKHIEDADYIFVPSRRIFANHTCLSPDGGEQPLSFLSGYESSRCDKLQKEYPRLNEYYRKLFGGELGFVQVAKFTSYPTVNFLNNKLFEQKDEDAEETWTVFDHPVIRIYKKV